MTTSPLTQSQYGIYVECVNHVGEVCYNLPYLYKLDKQLDADRLCRAVETAVKAHPALFTRIELNDDGEPVQSIGNDWQTWSLSVEDVGDISALKSSLTLPFNLVGDRLFRIRLFRTADSLYLFCDYHHIIVDGSSMKLILNDIEKAYCGQTLVDEELSLGEVALQEQAKRQSEAFEEDKLWYAREFDIGDVFTQLIPDCEETSRSEASLLRTLSIPSERVDAFCREHVVFRSTLFTSAFAFLLAKYNNEQESLFTTVYNGRKDKRLSNTVGMFVKTLPVYAKFDNDTTVLDFLKASEAQMSGCRMHDVYSYGDLMEDLKPQSNSMFAWHATLFADDHFAGTPMHAERIGNSTLDASLYLKAFILDGHYQVKAEYRSNEYSEELVSHFLESYEAVVDGMLGCEYLRDIALSTPEQTAVLDGFNHNDVEYDASQTIVSLFLRQAQSTPDNIAVVFQDHSYTYAEVNDLSNRIASYLSDQGLGAGDVVSVLIPRCEWMAIASLGILKAGCAYQPLDPSYPKERLNFMMEDAQTRLLMSLDPASDPNTEDGSGWLDGLAVLTERNIPVFDLNSALQLDRCSQPAAATITPDSLFILLYTSGSTGIPKGCQLTHGNLVAFCHWYHRFYNLRPEHRVAAYASYGFDACMMDMYPALTCGAAVHIVPEAIRLDLIALNDYFEQNAITHSFMTTQVGYQFASSIENHSLKYLSTGGEKLASIMPPAGYRFYNVYGPTECTIFTTTYCVEKKMKEIPIGKPLDNMRLYVVDAQGHRQPVGAAGELWVSGPQVSKGYLNRPEKTSEVYIDNPFLATEEAVSADERKYARVYRTGDIVRYLPDGNLQFVGRRDGQVKIRGFRIELKEVEAVIREFPGIKDATVQAFDVDDGTQQSSGGGKYIAAYIVSDEQIDLAKLEQFILDQKPPYMVPAVTMQIDAIPLNQNQKVNKRALPQPERKRAAAEAVNIPMNVLEEALHDLIAPIVNTDDFGVTTVLGYIGLTSITAIKLAVQVNKRYGIMLDAKTLVKTGTLQSIENEILKKMLTADDAGKERQESRVAGTKTDRAVPTRVPLSYAQTGVYFDCLKNPTSTVYNIPYLLTFPEGTDAMRLAAAVEKAVRSHQELHVHFTTEEDTIVQTTADSVELSFSEGRGGIITEMSEAQLRDYKNEFVRPFNLQKAPLYRFEVVKTERTVHLLMDIHHLVFDGGSADLLIRQICALLEGQSIEQETYTYLDFVSDQKAAESTDSFRSAQQFFAERLQTCEGASEIPSDLQKATSDGTQSEQPGTIGEAVCQPDFATVAAFCREQEITPAHLFLAATAYVVGRYTNNRDVYLCTVSSGRSNLRIADTVGMFVNTLALGLRIEDVSVCEYLHSVSDTFDQTLRHEDYPFVRIASDYAFRPAIAYAYQVGVLSDYTVGGQSVAQELLELNVPKFKINVKIESRGVVVQYDDSLYSARLGKALAESIVAVAERMVQRSDDKVRELSIVSTSQEEELRQMRQTACGESPFKLFHDCIAHFAQTQPSQEALVAIDGSFTYQAMDAATDRIACALRSRGVEARDRVALLLPRTSRLILSLFGVLKAGAAYIPCDPEYPADRVKLILEDSGARYIITTSDRLSSVPAEKAIDVETLLSAPVATNAASESTTSPVCCDNIATPKPLTTTVTPDDLAYLIYTSGSTGRPKGVMLRHEGICNYLYGHPANVFANAVMTDARRMLSVTTISFDAALQDIGMAFFNGKTLILATEEQANNPLDLARLINEQHINMVSGTPSRWQTWLTSDDFCQAISHVDICRAGGEKFSDQLLALMRRVTKARIFNCYGPTEITVASNNKELTHAQLVTVGKPQLNVKEFIVDSDGNELPVGVVGELYIGGRGVARGYNNLDEMTRERFVDYRPDRNNPASATRVYKSGDYAKWLPDGDVVILGRTDHQIKLRGLRIELGEIENVMLKVAGMEKVVILIRKLNGKEHLCAYYTADREILPEDLKAEIAKSLTQYMVPTAYLQMEEMPMTPNGKTDVKALPDPQLAVTSAYVEPVNDTERAFCSIFADILQMDKVGATDNFFELGGTSLVVTRVIIESDKAGLHVAYGDVFANPTPRQLARLITGETDSETTDDVTAFDYTSIDALLQRNTLGNFRKGQSKPLGNVMLTGATGYLGIHILRDLIDSDAQTIYCLVRGKSREKAEGRLRTLLFYYFADAFKELFGTRLHVVLGDVTDDISALMSQNQSGATVHIDTVFNCAAIVKHFSEGTEIEDVNIGGASRCADFCIQTGARLVHVSTASTRGLWVGEPKSDIFTEQRFYMGQYLGNKYIYSKFMAERLILDAVAKRGLDAKIMRVGNLAARSTDGEFQANFSTNSFMGRIRVYNMLGCCPYSMRNKRVEFSPINEVAHAIVLLATTPKECTVFHPYNIHNQFLGDVLSGLTSIGAEMRFVEQEEFAEAMEQAKNDEQKARSLASLLAYQDMAHGQKTTDVNRDNDYTTQVLYRLGFAWSPTSWDYVERMFTAIGGFGFFE